MASASRYSGVMLSKMAAASSSRAAMMAMPTRAFSTSLALRAPRQPSAAKDAPAKPKVRHNPLVGNYIPPQPLQLAPGSKPPVSTEHPNSTKPPQSSAEVPPNVDMPPPPPPAVLDASSLRNALDPNYRGKQDYAYDALADSSSLGNSSVPALRSSTPASDYKRIDILDIISRKANAFSDRLKANDPTSLPAIRTAPVLGRTVHIKRERAYGPSTALTATAAFRTLGRIVANERVPSKHRQQRYHERPGLKRKRLSSERWRARFRTGFKATVSRVMELKRQGW